MTTICTDLKEENKARRAVFPQLLKLYHDARREYRKARKALVTEYKKEHPQPGCFGKPGLRSRLEREADAKWIKGWLTYCAKDGNLEILRKNMNVFLTQAEEMGPNRFFCLAYGYTRGKTYLQCEPASSNETKARHHNYQYAAERLAEAIAKYLPKKVDLKLCLVIWIQKGDLRKDEIEGTTLVEEKFQRAKRALRECEIQTKQAESRRQLALEEIDRLQTALVGYRQNVLDKRQQEAEAITVLQKATRDLERTKK
jgi:hypothetical protein